MFNTAHIVHLNCLSAPAGRQGILSLKLCVARGYSVQISNLLNNFELHYRSVQYKYYFTRVIMQCVDIQFMPISEPPSARAVPGVVRGYSVQNSGQHGGNRFKFSNLLNNFELPYRSVQYKYYSTLVIMQCVNILFMPISEPPSAPAGRLGILSSKLWVARGYSVQISNLLEINMGKYS